MKKLDKKIFGTLFFAIFGTVTGVGIVVPLLPIYARDLGATGLYIGLIFGAFSISRTFLLPYFGRLSDRKGRKPVIATGLFAYAVVSLLFILARSFEGLIVIRFIQGIASAMIMPATQAYVGEITPGGREGSVMGLFNLSMFSGLSIGPLFGGVINDRFGLDTAFACMGVLAFAAFLLSFFLLPPTRSESAARRAKKIVPWKQLLRDKSMAGLLVFRLAYAACIGVIWSFLPVLADSEFSLTSSSIGILVMLGVFFSGLVHVPGGVVADRVNRKMMVAAGGVLICYAIFSFEWADSFHDLVVANILFGVGGGIAMPALMALAVLKGQTTEAMGSIMGLLSMAHSMGMLAGSLLAGLMMDIFQLRHAFPSGGVIMLLSIVIFLFCLYGKNGKPARAELPTGPVNLEI